MKDEPAPNIGANTGRLLDLTQAMLAAAKSDDWDEFILQEQQRNMFLERIFDSQTFEESTKLHLADVINEILLIDQVITRLIIQQRDQAAEELRHLKHARVGDKAYRVAIDSSE